MAGPLLGVDEGRSQSQVNDHFAAFRLYPGKGVDLLEAALGLPTLWQGVASTYHLQESERRLSLASMSTYEIPTLSVHPLDPAAATAGHSAETIVEAPAEPADSPAVSEALPAAVSEALAALDQAKARGLVIEPALDEAALMARLQAGCVAIVAQYKHGLLLPGHAVVAWCLGEEALIADPAPGMSDPMPWSAKRADWLRHQRETLLLTARRDEPGAETRHLP